MCHRWDLEGKLHVRVSRYRYQNSTSPAGTVGTGTYGTLPFYLLLCHLCKNGHGYGTVVTSTVPFHYLPTTVPTFDLLVAVSNVLYLYLYSADPD